MWSRLSVFEVEDNHEDVELTIEALLENKLAKNVVPVGDGVQAMEYLLCEGEYTDRKRGNPAVILLDIKMPEMDGRLHGLSVKQE